MSRCIGITIVFFAAVSAPTEISTLSLHDALPISGGTIAGDLVAKGPKDGYSALMISAGHTVAAAMIKRSEEHTSELQSPDHFVWSPLIEKKNSSILVRRR